jgi:hypothetical protein
METVIVIIVLLTLLVLFGGAGWFFVRETGVENAKLWLTSPRQMRQVVTPFRSGGPADAQELDAPDRTTPLLNGEPPTPALDDTRLRELAEELRGELTRASGLTRDFDARLTRIEQEVTATKALPESLDRTFKDVDLKVRKRYSKLKSELQTIRQADTPYAARRADAISGIYTRLARVEAALSAVVNPMLLPGEPLRVPESLFDDTLVWDNWADVGERAYEFGEMFNGNRLLLDPELADTVEEFICTLREALTDTIYPVVRHNSPTSAQTTQLRAGLERVVGSLAPLRRELEDAFRVISTQYLADDDDDDDDEISFHA